MNLYKIGQNVSIKGKNEEIFVIEGYQLRLEVKSGKRNEEVVYVLRNKENGNIIKEKEEKIFADNKNIDQLLDEYNDYQDLYNNFKDEKYRSKLKMIEKIISYKIKDKE